MMRGPTGFEVLGLPGHAFLAHEFFPLGPLSLKISNLAALTRFSPLDLPKNQMWFIHAESTAASKN
jgi:hypothetical protein